MDALQLSKGLVRAMVDNRRRLKGGGNRHLQKQRIERVERSFAHVCETSGVLRCEAWKTIARKFVSGNSSAANKIPRFQNQPPFKHPHTNLHLIIRNNHDSSTGL